MMTKLRVGQVWETRGGDMVKITGCDSYDRSYPWKGNNGCWYTSEGYFWGESGEDHRDLVELISDAP